MSSSKKLFEPIKLGNVELKNRVVMLGMSTGLGDNYSVTDRLVDFYSARAKGGTALMILGSAYVADFRGTDPGYKTINAGSGIWSDEFIPGLKKLTTAIRENGGKSCCQLALCCEWRANSEAPLEGVGPSEGPGGPGVRKLRELTVDEIHLIIDQFSDGARRAREAGFDMIEFHCGIGYFINRFISSFSNKRTDEYGGTLEKRMRFLLEVIAASKKKAGDDYPIICRISGDELMPGGHTMVETKQIVPILEKAGVAALSVQAGWHESPQMLVQQWVPAGAWVYMAEEVKKITKVPVMAAYRIDSAELAEDIVAQGRADMVGLARALIADPEFANKAREGRPETIRRCIACCRCLDDIFVGETVHCSVNAAMGRDLEQPAPGNKKVVVIGSGPSGMEAARIAAKRGHKVTLFDRNSRLGGLLVMAQILNERLERLVSWFNQELRGLPIDIRLNTEVTTALLDQMKPDVIIVAPGGEPIVPDVPGVNGKNVLGGFDMKKMIEGHAPKAGLLWTLAALGAKYFGGNPAFMRWGMTLPWPVKKRLAIIGGGFAGCEVAMGMMAGREVTIIEESKSIGRDIGIVDKRPTMDILKNGGVKMETLTKVRVITPEGVRVGKADGSEGFIAADTVMLSLGVKENRSLAEQLSARYKNVHLIGDACGGGIRRIREAIADGFALGMKI